ncbi:MAG: endonuclease/exonuclease/phosphatase family protein [Bacteroidetes bacterium]|nr:endonuclease/exonuclease/phosphatase family protein [Bacteroidota bacterium]
MPAETSRFTRLLHKALFVLNVLTVLPAALSLLAPFVPSTTWWVPNVLALLLPWLLLPLVIWLIVWVPLRRWKFLLLNVVLLALSWPQISLSWQYNGPGPRSRFDIRVLTLNAKAFSYKHSQWAKTKDFIVSQKPDIVCLQEFYEVQVRKPSYFAQMKQELGFKYHQFIELAQGKRFGLLVLSRFPILDAGAVTEVTRRTRNGIMYADLELYGQRLRLYNMHLESYRLSDADRGLVFENTAYAQAEPEADNTPRTRKRRRKQAEGVQDAPAEKPAKPHPAPKQADPNEGTRAIAQSGGWWSTTKLMLSKWRIHLNQVALYQDHLVQWGDRPTIVCADLNNTPYSYIYRQVRGNLHDSFLVKGSGMGKTYGSGFLSLRIDYVFASPQLTLLEHKLLDTEGISDHKGLLVRLRLAIHQ